MARENVYGQNQNPSRGSRQNITQVHDPEAVADPHATGWTISNSADYDVNAAAPAWEPIRHAHG
jgi:hypothetical protein